MAYRGDRDRGRQKPKDYRDGGKVFLGGLWESKFGHMGTMRDLRNLEDLIDAAQQALKDETGLTFFLNENKDGRSRKDPEFYLKADVAKERQERGGYRGSSSGRRRIDDDERDDERNEDRGRDRERDRGYDSDDRRPSDRTDDRPVRDREADARPAPRRREPEPDSRPRRIDPEPDNYVPDDDGVPF